MELQAAVIFTSLQIAKFTSMAGYTSCRPTFIENVMTIFGQCINVLNYKVVYLVAFGDITWKLSKHNFVISTGRCPFKFVA